MDRAELIAHLADDHKVEFLSETCLDLDLEDFEEIHAFIHDLQDAIRAAQEEDSECSTVQGPCRTHGNESQKPTSSPISLILGSVLRKLRIFLGLQ